MAWPQGFPLLLHPRLGSIVWSVKEGDHLLTKTAKFGVNSFDAGPKGKFDLHWIVRLCSTSFPVVLTIRMTLPSLTGFSKTAIVTKPGNPVFAMPPAPAALKWFGPSLSSHSAAQTLLSFFVCLYWIAAINYPTVKICLQKIIQSHNLVVFFIVILCFPVYKLHSLHCFPSFLPGWCLALLKCFYETQLGEKGSETLLKQLIVVTMCSMQ